MQNTETGKQQGTVQGEQHVHVVSLLGGWRRNGATRGRILRKSWAVTPPIRVCYNDGCDLHPVGKEERRAQI